MTSTQQIPTLHALLEQLFADNREALKCLSAVRTPGLSMDEKKMLLNEMQRCALPKHAHGRRYSKDSFWAKFCGKMILRWAFLGNTDQQQRHVKWLSENINKAQRPVFTAPAIYPPQPNERRI